MPLTGSQSLLFLDLSVRHFSCLECPNPCSSQGQLLSIYRSWPKCCKGVLPLALPSVYFLFPHFLWVFPRLWAWWQEGYVWLRPLAALTPSRYTRQRMLSTSDSRVLSYIIPVHIPTWLFCTLKGFWSMESCQNGLKGSYGSLIWDESTLCPEIQTVGSCTSELSWASGGEVKWDSSVGSR